MTAQQQKSRRQMLEDFVAANPNDSFARYGLALECVRSGENEAALDHLRKLIAEHPDYVAGHQQFGQLLTRLGRKDEARAAFRAGIEAAIRAGNEHARSEMATSLAELA